jgi:hypothetical protein
MAYDATLLDQTIQVWQPYYEDTLTREDARVILDNMTAYFRILLEWGGHREMTSEGGQS